MKRKALKQMEPAKLTVKTDKEFAVEALIWEIDGHQILELDIWGKTPIGEREMICRHFLDKEAKDYDTLFMSNQEFERKTYVKGEWTKLKLVTVFSEGGYSGWYYVSGSDIVVKNPEVINEYLQGRYTGSITGVEYMETEISSEKRDGAYSRKMARIEDRMNRVEPLEIEPFNKWLETVVFPERYIFAETREIKRGYRCRCAECGKTFMAKEKPKHNTEMTCKKCGTKAIVKTRVQQMEEKRAVLVAQPYDEKCWVLRHFKFRRISGTVEKETKSTIMELEKARIFIRAGGTITEKIYYGQDNNYGNDEFLQSWWDTRGYTGMVLDKNFYMYPGYLEEIDMPENLRGALTAGAAAGAQMDYNTLVRGFQNYPYIEYLIKGRYYNLASDIIKKNGWWSAPEELLYEGADNVPDLLQIEPQRAYRLRDAEGGLNVLKFLQLEEMTGMKISQENLEFIKNNEIKEEDLQRYRTGMTVNKELNYIRRQMQKNKQSYKTIQQYYKDYLDMAAHRGADLEDDIIRADPRMVERHMEYLEELNRAKNEKRVQELRKKFPNIKKDYAKNAEMMAWEKEDYIIVVPHDVEDIVKEGQQQHHCVASSDRYFDSMNRRETFILFLRKAKQRETPYYTLEVKITNGKIGVVQKYAAYDRQPDIGMVNKVLTAWKHDIETRLKKQMQAAG